MVTYGQLWKRAICPNDDASALRSPAGFPQYQVFAMGGLQNLWDGASLRFIADDFASWPISFDDLAPRYTPVERGGLDARLTAGVSSFIRLCRPRWPPAPVLSKIAASCD
jgi:hypothetical protein